MLPVYKFEYRHVSTKQYRIYYEKAQLLLSEISAVQSIPVQNLTYKDIISYFTANYNIHFSFFDLDPLKKRENRSWARAVPNKGWIKYKDVIKDASFTGLDEEIVKRVSGFTIPDGNRVLIMINQDCVFPRLIFTILHELCHFYFHINNELNQDVFVSLTGDKLEGKYSKEMIPFEDEANNIASMLFCPKQKLEEMLLNDMKFKYMCRAVGMSGPAMHNRFLNYFEHILEMPHSLALKNVWSARNGDRQVRNLVKYKIRALKKREEAERIETLELIKLQSAYVDKLNASPFWQSIISDEEEYCDEFSPEYLIHNPGEEYLDAIKLQYTFPNPLEEYTEDFKTDYLVSDPWNEYKPFK